MCAAIGTEGPRRAGGVARAARADEAVASLLLPVDIPLWARQTDRCALAPGFPSRLFPWDFIVLRPPSAQGSRRP